MPIAQPLAFLKIPYPLLIALDDRTLHFWMQPVHFLVRLTHVVAAAAFFGGIVLLDLRLIGLRRGVALRPLAEHTLSWLYGTFAVAIAAGILLFLYDPVHVGSHAYFVPKMILLLFGLANAALFHRIGYVNALASVGRLPLSARAAGTMSLLFWFGVMACACLDTEAMPKVFLR